MTDMLVTTNDLAKHYPSGGQFVRGPAIRAVDGVSFQIAHGGSMGLVGESGSGKSTIARVLLRLQEPTGGQFLFDGQDVFALPPQEMRRLRARMQIVHQNPMAALHPRMTVSSQLRRPLIVQGLGSRVEQDQAIEAIIAQVGLRPEHAHRLPHEFSGGQRQRISIARAIITAPEFLVLDEPTSALDVSVQAQILRLLWDLRRARGLTYLLVSHDLGVIRHMCDTVAVMYLGQLVEVAAKADLFARPQHPYTKALLSVVPVPDPALRNRARTLLTGEIPSARNPPLGCRFHTRCPAMMDKCRKIEPPMQVLSPSHSVACHLVQP